MLCPTPSVQVGECPTGPDHTRTDVGPASVDGCASTVSHLTAENDHVRVLTGKKIPGSQKLFKILMDRRRITLGMRKYESSKELETTKRLITLLCLSSRLINTGKPLVIKLVDGKPFLSGHG